jgi:flagellar biosynthesis protein FlhB
MAEQDADKTEAATPRKRQDALEEGKIARSQDLIAAMLILASVVLMGWMGQRLLLALKRVMIMTLGDEALHNFSPPDTVNLIIAIIVLVTTALWPLLVCVIGVAVFVNVLQVGLNLTTKKLQPKLDSLNPLQGIKRIFSGGRGPMNLLLNIAKLVLVTLVAYSAIHGKMEMILGISSLTHTQILEQSAIIIYDIALRVAVVLFILAIIDYAWQKWRFEQDLMMTKQEVKDEMKRMEGDPQIKMRRRQIQFQRAMQRINTEVPKADVIVTNPTHYAVALQYDNDAMTAPKVVAKGADFLAQKIREIAIANGIPIIERPPLARALYKECDVGQEIPESLYSAVAEILAYVYELSGKARRKVGV